MLFISNVVLAFLAFLTFYDTDQRTKYKICFSIKGNISKLSLQTASYVLIYISMLVYFIQLKLLFIFYETFI